jgi:hypothetical protein
LAEILEVARESRNELVHEAMLGYANGFDKMSSIELGHFFSYFESLMLKLIKGDVLF